MTLHRPPLGWKRSPRPCGPVLWSRMGVRRTRQGSAEPEEGTGGEG